MKKLSKESRDNIVFGGAVLAVAIIIGFGIGFAPPLADWLNDGAEPVTTTSADVIEISVRIALAVVATVAGWLTFRRIRATERTADANKSGQETDRFSSAIDQLGADKVNIRIGGLYSLQALTQDNPERFAATIYDVVIAFIQEQTKPDPTVEQARQKWIDRKNEIEMRYLEGEGPPPDHYDEERSPIPEWPSTSTDVETAFRILATSRRLFDEHHPRLECNASTELGGPNLTAVDLSQRILKGLDLSFATIANSTLAGATIANSTLAGATITDTGFVGATITKATFVGATITDSILSRAKIDTVDFTEVSAHSVSFFGAAITGTYFHTAAIMNSTFAQALITDSSFTDAPITDSDFYEATITDTGFERATIEDASFAGADMTNVYFTEATMANVVGLATESD